MHEEEMDTPCLIFGLQWKGEKLASLGILDKEDASLHWAKFKSYLGQNLGTTDDISVAYLDSEGDEIPIDSECEFQEALKFARRQAKNNEEIILKVDKMDTFQLNGKKGAKEDKIVSYLDTLKNISSPAKTNAKKEKEKDLPAKEELLNYPFIAIPDREKEKAPIKKGNEEAAKKNQCLNFPFSNLDDVFSCECDNCSPTAAREVQQENEPILEPVSVSKETIPARKIKLMRVRSDTSSPPEWFTAYMRKFKSEVLESIRLEVSTIVRKAVKSEINNAKCNEEKNIKELIAQSTRLTAILHEKENQKKSSDEESSDAPGASNRNVRLHKEKEHKHKKGGKKIDAKLEKLENKTKKLLEKKAKSMCEKKEKSDNEGSGQCQKLQSRHLKKQKKKSSDEDSSDTNLIAHPQRDVKLLKKIERLHRSGEKKFEKLYSKSEKLETKTKRLLERKSQSKSRSEKTDKSTEPIDKGIKQRKRSSDISVATYLMDATLIDLPLSVIHCAPGEQFIKAWNVTNSGTLPWTDKTELCLLWGTPGMRFEKKVIKCPHLRPGEVSQIKVKAQAPLYPGTFESYWHFYHMGERFGHWIDCAVIVDGNHEVRSKHQACENTKNVDFLQNFEINNMALLEKIGNEKEVEEKIIQMAELTQKLHGLQMDFTKQTQNKRYKVDDENDEQNNSDSLTNSNASDTVKENQRKIAENMVEIQKRLDDISLLHTPPTANKILEMAFGDEFFCRKDSVDERNDESDNPDEIEINHITGKNIEPAEWKMLQLHPEFLKSCDLLREIQIRDEEMVNDNVQHKEKSSNENLCTLKRDCHQHACESYDFNDLSDFVSGYQDNDLNKHQEVSDTFDKNIEGDQKIDAKVENKDEKTKKANEKDREYESDSDSELSVISNFSTPSESEDDSNDSNFIVVPMPSGAHSPECKVCQASEMDDFLDLHIEDPEAMDEFLKSKIPTKTENEKKEKNPKEEGKSNLTPSVRFTDSNGKTIYAVTSHGNCWPVEAIMNERQFRDASSVYPNDVMWCDPPPFQNENQFTEDTPVNRNRRARFGDNDKNESKTKKLKSSRPSEYHFNAADLPEKTMKLFPEPPSTFTFTAKNDENEKCRPCCSNCGGKQEDKRDKNGNPGKKSFNRHSNFNANANANVFNQAGHGQPWRGNNDQVPTVDLLPSPLLNGVLNVASSAFSTARTVLNNIQSTMTPIVEQGCSDRSQKPSKKDQKDQKKARPSIEMLCKLYEMGFKNVALNQKLMELYENDVNKVIDDLLNTKN